MDVAPALGQIIKIFVMVILPLAITLWAIGNRFKDHGKEIMELKKRINKLENKKDQDYNTDEKFYCEYRDYEVTYRKTCKNCIVASIDEDGNFYCPYYKD